MGYEDCVRAECKNIRVMPNDQHICTDCRRLIDQIDWCGVWDDLEQMENEDK